MEEEKVLQEQKRAMEEREKARQERERALQESEEQEAAAARLEEEQFQQRLEALKAKAMSSKSPISRLACDSLTANPGHISSPNSCTL